MNSTEAPPPQWVFGYGSLIWRPGFAHLRVQPAVLRGWHRAFCRYSHRHRGTPQQPGLVMGLREGGECRGMALQVAPAAMADALAYLDAREGAGYERHALLLDLLPAPGAPGELPPSVEPQTVLSWVYLPNQAHPSYFGELPRERLLHLLRTGRGESGTALDYVRNLLDGLRPLGVREPDWEALLAEAEAAEAEAVEAQPSGPL